MGPTDHCDHFDHSEWIVLSDDGLERLPERDTWTRAIGGGRSQNGTTAGVIT
jgi:hypothetical protein